MCQSSRGVSAQEAIVTQAEHSSGSIQESQEHFGREKRFSFFFARSNPRRLTPTSSIMVVIDDHLLIRGGGGERIRLGRTLPIRELSCVHWHLSISEIQWVPYVDVCIDGYLNRQKKARELPLEESLPLLP